jgi:hypothetical protein
MLDALTGRPTRRNATTEGDGAALQAVFVIRALDEVHRDRQSE